MLINDASLETFMAAQIVTVLLNVTHSVFELCAASSSKTICSRNIQEHLHNKERSVPNRFLFSFFHIFIMHGSRTFMLFLRLWTRDASIKDHWAAIQLPFQVFSFAPPGNLFFFQMAYNLILVTVVLFAFAMAGPGGPRGGPGGRDGPGGPHGGPGGPHGGHHGGPPFLANVSREGRKEFEAVFKNESLTISQIDTQVAALAEKYGVSVCESSSSFSEFAITSRPFTRSFKPTALLISPKSKRTRPT